MKSPQELLIYKDYLVKWLQLQVRKTKMNGVIVGLSGGVDSSLVAYLAREALGDNAHGLIMPIGDMGQDEDDANDVAKFLNLNCQRVDLTSTFETLSTSLNLTNHLAIANLKPRLRMTTIYAIAQERKLLVLGTDNAAEWMLGYFTKYGDGGVDLLPIVYLLKSEVTLLAKLVKLPKNVYTKAPTAALWPGQTDEKELGFSYNYVDLWIEKKAIPPAIEAKILRQVASTMHKRKSLPRPKALRKLP